MNLPSENQDLGLALLTAEFEGGGYQPISPVSTLAEARELAQSDLRARTRQLASGDEATCPAQYRLWKRDDRGTFQPVAQIAL